MNLHPFPETPIKIQIILIALKPIFIKAAIALIDRFPELALVAEAEEYLEALDQIALKKPNLILLDLDMPDKLGLEMIRSLKLSRPGLKIITVSLMDTRTCMKAAFQAGADDFISKTRLSEDLISSIQRTMPEMEI